MWKLDVLQYQWLVIAMAGGVVVLLGVILAYMAMWRPRESEITEETALATKHQASFGFWLVSFLPWVLIVTFAGLAVWAAVYVLYMAAWPPNW